MRCTPVLIAACLTTLGASTGRAQVIYPLDRAEILSGSRFDFKVEFPGASAPDDVAITINGQL